MMENDNLGEMHMYIFLWKHNFMCSYWQVFPHGDR